MNDAKKSRTLHKDYEEYLATNSHWADGTMATTRFRLGGFPLPSGLTPEWFRKRMTEISPATARAEKVLVLSFLRWKDADVKAWANVKVPKFKGGITHDDIYKASDLLAIIHACTHPRDVAMVQVLYESAARRGEMIGMEFKDVVFKEDGTALLSLVGKTGARQVPIMESVPALRDWMNLHPTGTGPIWVRHTRMKDEKGNLSVSPLSGPQFYAIIRALVEKAGLDRPVRRVVHMFRHSRATDFVRMDVRGMALNKLMGWAKGSNMEAVYVHLAFDDVENEVRAKIFGLGEKALLPETPMKAILCPKCDTLNKAGARLCSKCSSPLSLKEALEKLDKQQKVAVSGFILEEILANPEEAMFDEYIAIFGERIEKLMEPIVAKLFAKEREREKQAGH
jgi:integrase